MSYAALRGFGVTECPEGWSWNAEVNECRSTSATSCPPGFDQRVPGACWPSTPTACKDLFGTFYNPAEPDRCKKACPSGTAADENNVCKPVAVISSLTVGLLVLGAVAIAVVLKGSR